jgi:hypothetical protein
MSKLITHLRSHRRRADFSREEVAFLLGKRSGADASHYERFIHEPTLRAAMAFEVIFRASLKELFAGMYDKVECDVIKRARKLLRRLPVEHVSHGKFRSFMAIVEPPVEDLRWEPIARP